MALHARYDPATGEILAVGLPEQITGRYVLALPDPPPDLRETYARGKYRVENAQLIAVAGWAPAEGGA